MRGLTLLLLLPLVPCAAPTDLTAQEPERGESIPIPVEIGVPYLLEDTVLVELERSEARRDPGRRRRLPDGRRPDAWVTVSGGESPVTTSNRRPTFVVRLTPQADPQLFRLVKLYTGTGSLLEMLTRSWREFPLFLTGATYVEDAIPLRVSVVEGHENVYLLQPREDLRLRGYALIDRNRTAGEVFCFLVVKKGG